MMMVLVMMNSSHFSLCLTGEIEFQDILIFTWFITLTVLLSHKISFGLILQDIHHKECSFAISSAIEFLRESLNRVPLLYRYIGD